MNGYGFRSFNNVIEKKINRFLKRGIFKQSDFNFINKKIIYENNEETTIVINPCINSVIVVECIGNTIINLDPNLIYAQDKPTTFFLKFINAGNYSVSFGFPIEWPKGTIPAFTANGNDWIGFLKNPEYLNWECFSLGLDMKLPA